MWHLVSVCIAQRFGQSAARADPTTVSAFAPEIDDSRYDDKRLHEGNGQPPAHRFAAECVPHEERPGQDQAEGSPVFAAVIVGDDRKECIGDIASPAAVESTIVA